MIEDDAAALLDFADEKGISDERLKLAARLGDPRARVLFPKQKPLSDPADADLSTDEKMELALRGWVIALCFDRESSARAALAVSRRALGFFSRLLPNNTRASAALKATHAWISCPCDRHVVQAENAEASAALAILSAREVEIPSGDERVGWPLSASLAARSAHETVQTVLDPKPSRHAASAANWFRVALLTVANEYAADGWVDRDDDALRPQASKADRRRILEVLQGLIAGALLPWALGEGSRD
jgi:hypothetical protein